MITNALLEEQYRVQKQLVEEAGYDIQKYSANLQTMLKNLQQQYGLTLHYGQPAGWTAKFMGRPSEEVKLA